MSLTVVSPTSEAIKPRSYYRDLRPAEGGGGGGGGVAVGGGQGERWELGGGICMPLSPLQSHTV